MNPATIVRPDATEATPVVAPVAFTRASFEHEEPIFDKSYVPGASSVQVGPESIASYGYMAALYIEVTATGGTGTAAVYKPDAPFSILSDITLLDVNGAPIVGPISGYDLYLVNKWGGYDAFSNPAAAPDYAATTNGNFRFAYRIPVQIGRRDGLGALPNMNSAANYQIRASVAPLSAVYSTNPTAAPTSVRITAHLEAWAQPTATDRMGAPQATQPPALGTTSFWSKNTQPVLLGNNVHKLTRQGNLLRNLIFVARDNTGARSDSIVPAELRWMFDGQEIINRSRAKWVRAMYERSGMTPDVGVYVLDFTHDFDGSLGAEMRDLWWPTEQSSKSELVGSWGAAGSLDILTNDVAVTSSPFVGS